MMQEELLNDKKQSDGLFFVIILFIVFFIFYFITSTFMFVQVDGDSMNDTLIDKDVLIVNRNATVNRGDVIVFDEKTHGKLIKRVIAVEGDEIKSIDNVLYVKYFGCEEFVALNEDYIKSPNYILSIPHTKIKSGELYVLGDNRANSQDSRVFGSIKLSSVNGVVSEWAINNKKFSTFVLSWIFCC